MKKENGRKKKIMLCVSLLVTSLLFGGCERKPQKVTCTGIGMGTVISQTIYTSGSTNVTDEISTLLTKLEISELTRRDEAGAVYRINAAAGSSEGAVVTKELYSLLARCEEINRESDSALDITLGALVELWNIDEAASGEEAYNLPGEKEIEAALAGCGISRMKLIEEENTCRVVLEDNTVLDLGAVGKGYALDVIRDYLKKNEEVKGAAVSVGGSVLVYGSKPDGSDWKVAITNPFTPGAAIGMVSLKDGMCLSTSGDYERFVEVDGVRYHHILDGRTGYPAKTDVRSVTVLGDDGFLTDALSTACFILGADKGKILAEKYGCEALFVCEDGSFVMTGGMESIFTPAD